MNTFASVAGYTGSVYKKSNVSYATSGPKAPMSNDHSVIEFSLDGQALDGVQIGRTTTDMSSEWEGTFFELLVYTRVLGDMERRKIYQYFAKRYHLWEKSTDTGPYVFPFSSDWGPDDPRRKKVLSDEAEDGTMIHRTKRGKKRFPKLRFTKRLPDEVTATEQFWDEHHPGTQFVYRDRTVLPPADLTVKFAPDSEMPVIPGGPTNFAYELDMHES